ncbi:MAG: arginine--tRNA ligase [Parcubacteria group bacterium CG2_30_44_11]|nr:MAG: arginine--tRNA ligase [Parcubacteria group bacterium CG2_30_44_11]
MEAEIRQIIEGVLHKLGVSGVDFVVEHPADLSYGDYATNVALVVSKQLGKPPKLIAQQIQTSLEEKLTQVKNITIAGPGFINFCLSREYFTDQVKMVLLTETDWGKNEIMKGKRVVVEYTDPNPFKEFHIGHMFTNIVGESIARLFMMTGAEVKCVCYQGDVGLHVAHAIWGMKQLGITTKTKFTAKDLGSAYAKGASAYKEDETAKAEITALNKVIYERTDEAVNDLYDAGRAVSLAYFETIYALLGTKFDEYFFESEVAVEGKRLVLAHPDVFPLSDGAHVFVGENYGLHTRVFLNNQGLPTYEAKELALAKLKDERLCGYDHSVISTAKEINEYFKVLKQAMSFVYPSLAAKTEHIGHGMVRLANGKMSSRTGNVIAATEFIADVADTARERIAAAGVADVSDELANDIAVGAIKYATLKGSILQDSVFDKDKALSFEGDSGPYLQYTYARILSVLEKANGNGVVPNIVSVPLVPYELERMLYRFPEVIEVAYHERAPHKVVTFLTELASVFNGFYATEKIANANDVYASYKAAVAKAVAITLKNGLWVLGIKAPEKM